LCAVLFDLDGTLVDTLPDIAAGMNAALVELDLRPLDTQLIGSFIGKGPRILAQRVLDEQATLDNRARSARIEPLLAAYVKNYEPRVGAQSTLFPGVRDAMTELSAAGLKLGVVTNALQHLAEAILVRFDLARFMRVVLGGDRVAKGKPNPDPLWDACRMLGTAPDRTLMVGDSDNDVIAARAAGCPVVAVPHGYNAGVPIASLGCDIVDNFTLLPTYVADYGRVIGAY
jgi:phosphoglycolate phosphatase